MLSKAGWLKPAALMAAGALAVHQLRFFLAFGDQAHSELAATGHGYLSWVTLGVGLLLAGAVGAFIHRLCEARRVGFSTGSRRNLLAVWALAAGALLAIYMGQELLEGLLSPGHADGIHGVFGHGGWLALPTALAIGGLIALLVAGAFKLVAAVARASRSRARGARGRSRPARPTCVALPRQSPLATSRAGRAPPPAAALT